MLFLYIDMTQVVEILPEIRQGPTHSTQSISWLLCWRLKEFQCSASAQLLQAKTKTDSKAGAFCCA